MSAYNWTTLTLWQIPDSSRNERYKRIQTKQPIWMKRSFISKPLTRLVERTSFASKGTLAMFILIGTRTTKL